MAILNRGASISRVMMFVCKLLFLSFGGGGPNLINSIELVALSGDAILSMEGILALDFGYN